MDYERDTTTTHFDRSTVDQVQLDRMNISLQPGLKGVDEFLELGRCLRVSNKGEYDSAGIETEPLDESKLMFIVE